MSGVKLFFAGDFCAKPSTSIIQVSDELRDLVQSCDLRVVNFEVPLKPNVSLPPQHDERFFFLVDTPVFLKNKYILGDNFSMLDVALAPLLWRLDYYGIELSRNAAPLLKYAERIFARPAYIEALTPSEKVMRK